MMVRVQEHGLAHHVARVADLTLWNSNCSPAGPMLAFFGLPSRVVKNDFLLRISIV